MVCATATATPSFSLSRSRSLSRSATGIGTRQGTYTPQPNSAHSDTQNCSAGSPTNLNDNDSASKYDGQAPSAILLETRLKLTGLNHNLQQRSTLHPHLQPVSFDILCNMSNASRGSSRAALLSGTNSSTYRDVMTRSRGTFKKASESLAHAYFSSGHSKLGLPALLHNLTILQNQLKLTSNSASVGTRSASSVEHGRNSSVNTSVKDCSNKSFNVNQHVGQPDNMDMLSSRVSALRDEIKTFWQGRHSPRQQVEMLRRRHESTQESILSLEESQECLKERILYLEKCSNARDKSLQRIKEERQKSVQQAKPNCGEGQGGGCGGGSTAEQQFLLRRLLSKSGGSPEMVKIAEFWSENNCDFHVNRILCSLRQVAAYEILEFAHNRLTSYMIAHILMTGKEHTGMKRMIYLRTFGLEEDHYYPGGFGLGLPSLHHDAIYNSALGRFGAWGEHGVDRSSPNNNVYNITYADVLDCVEQQMQGNRRAKKELVAALRAAEKGLLEEAEAEGYNGEDVGDIRWQMSGFKALEAKFSKTRYVYVCNSGSGSSQLMNCKSSPGQARSLSSMSTSSCLPLSMYSAQPGAAEEAKDVVDDIIRTIEEGDLGALDRAAKLIRLGCYFLENQRIRNCILRPPTGADELDQLSIDLGSQSD